MWSAIFGILIALAGHAAQAQARLPDGFVFLRDLDPSIAQDMRYAASDNFVGRPLPGYGAAECVLRADAALALKRVQAGLAGSGFSLKVYDCYRPQRAANAMARWAGERHDNGATKRFYPALAKQSLFASGYIAPRSAHSAGTAVDLTLIATGSETAPAFDRSKPYGPCNGPAAQRSPDNSLDMGTSFDCFDQMSHTRSPAIDPAQRQRREALRAAMTRQGFKNYFREWWHFSYAGGAVPAVFDFPIPPR
jgi:D-alanyl-D-alanine dipeptidase